MLSKYKKNMQYTLIQENKVYQYAILKDQVIELVLEDAKKNYPEPLKTG